MRDYLACARIFSLLSAGLVSINVVGSEVVASERVASESVCFGTTSNGRLQGGVAMPGKGKNFIAYSSIAAMMGRTYVHSKTRDILLSAYRQLESQAPNKVFKYAETGYEQGGRFKPHKTHQNGLSVDFMVPVVDSDGKSVHLPTHVFNRFGYDIEFDKKGRYRQYTIDYETMAAHLVALHKAAKKHKVELWRVLFAPELQTYLYATQYGAYIKKHILIPAKKSWVRHDEHYHVDFKVPCKPL